MKPNRVKVVKRKENRIKQMRKGHKKAAGKDGKTKNRMGGGKMEKEEANTWNEMKANLKKKRKIDRKQRKKG